MPGSPYRRPLVSGRTEYAYQCSRAFSSFLAISTFSKGEELPEYSDPDKQHDCQDIHKPLRGYPLTYIELCSNLAVEMVPGSPALPDS